MTRRFFSGNTLEQTVMTAARHFGVDPDELAYRQIEKRHGFLRTRKAVMIAVDPENPRRQSETAAAAPEPTDAGLAEVERGAPAESKAAPAAADAPVEDAGQAAEATPERDAWRPEAEEPQAAEPPARRAGAAAPPASPAMEDADDHGRSGATPEIDDGELLSAAETAARILMHFAGIDAEATAEWGDERIEVEVEGPDASVLVVEGGKGLLAIQHLLPRMLRGQTGRSSFVRVDSQGFHQNRRERLEELALKEAEAVSRNGSARTLPPMAPDERRIVHLAVRDIPTVETESRGTGLHKRVVIRPVTGDGGHEDIEARHGF